MAEQLFGENELSRFYDSLFRPAGTESAQATALASNRVESLLRALVIDDPNSQNPHVEKLSRAVGCNKMIKIINKNLKGGDDPNQQKLAELIKVIGPANVAKIKGDKSPSIEAVFLDIDALADDEKPPDAKPVDLCFILLNSYGVSPALRNMNRFMLIMHAISTIQLSRCTPYLNVRVQTSGRSTKRGTSAPPMTLLNFLERPFKVDSAAGTADSLMANSMKNGKSLSLDENAFVTPGTEAQARVGLPISGFASGMELFTSPQTLINPDLAIQNDNRNDTIDPYRPFMSIDSLKIRHESKGHISRLSYKSGEMSITLHDRSRLSDISHFVSPDQFVGTFLRIEYGWYHPDGIEINNPSADLLNSMRKVERYQVINSSFNMTPEGQVKITLRIAMAAAHDARRIRIYEGSVSSLHRDIQKLSTNVSRLLDELGLQPGSKKLRKITGHQILTAVDSYARQPQINDKLKKTFFRLDASLKRLATGEKIEANKAKIKEIRKDLTNLIKGGRFEGTGDQAEKSKLSEFKASIDNVIRRQIFALGTGKDPFIEQDHAGARVKERTDAGDQKLAKKGKKIKIGPGRVFSFAKAMLVFFGSPMVKESLGIQEMQFIFYPLNDTCAEASGRNIGSFLVQLDYFKQEFQKEIYRRNNVNMSLEDFTSWFIKKFMEDPFAYYYGFQRREGQANDPGDPRIKGTRAFKAFAKDEDKLRTTRDALLKTDSFTMPKVEYIIESIPMEQPEGGGEAGGHMVRVHFLDRSATPHIAQDQMLRAARESQLAELKPLTTEQGKEFQKSEAIKVLENASKAGLITIKDVKTGNIVTNASAGELKRFIKRSMPQVTYGANNSMVLNASVTSQQNQLLSTVNMIRAGQNGPLTPAGAGYGGVPLQVLPVKMTSNLIGCPIVEIMQQVFWDFSTNTDVDDIYGVIKYEHDLGPGKFTTSVDWIPIRAYGTYRTAFGVINKASELLADAKGDANDTGAT